MCEARPAVVKIAVTPRTFADGTRAFGAVRARARERGSVPLIALSMGRLGLPTAAGRPLRRALDMPPRPRQGAKCAGAARRADAMANLYRVRDVTTATASTAWWARTCRSLSPALHNRASRTAA